MGGAKYKYAGYWPRMWAYNTDLLILLVVYYFLTLFIDEARILYGICFVVTVLYHAIFESSKWQATPGKRIMKLKVTNHQGDRIDVIKGVARFMLKIISLLIFYIGFIMIGFSKRGQGLHDKLAGTLVISDTPGSNL